MTALRVLKALTVCAFLVLITTAGVFRFSINGYTQTLTSLRASFGDGAYIFIAIFSVVTLVATPIFGITGIVAMGASRRLGRPALLLGFLCCAVSFANLLLMKKYGGMPTHDTGIQAVQSSAKPVGGPKQPATTPSHAP
jgi:hypothetical protein